MKRNFSSVVGASFSNGCYSGLLLSVISGVGYRFGNCTIGGYRWCCSAGCWRHYRRSRPLIDSTRQWGYRQSRWEGHGVHVAATAAGRESRADRKIVIGRMRWELTVHWEGTWAHGRCWRLGAVVARVSHQQVRVRNRMASRDWWCVLFQESREPL